MEELARQSDPAQGAEVLSPDKETEQAGTVTTNPALAAEQVAMQAMYD